MANIADQVASCLEAFRSVSAITPGEVQEHSEKARWKICDQFSRFKVWSGNIGAHQQGRSSLDYRLRDASHLTTQVKNLLSDLKNLLDTACSILEGTQVPWEQDIPDEEEEDNDVMSGPEEDNIGFSTKLDQISADVVEVINCLLNLSVSIRNPAPHDRFRGSINTDTSFYEHADIAHIKEKYEQADPKLIKQLGKANSRRRQYFKYRESHHQKLSHGIEMDRDSAERQSTAASSIPSAMKANMSAFTATVDLDELSDSGLTRTSYAPSAETPDRSRFPALPAEASKGPFECPFCFMMINVSTSYAWRKHVYEDLRPYSCVAIDCPISGTEFGKRRQWMEHMLQSHWRDWHCSFCAHEHLTSALSFQNHIMSAHAGMVSRDELEAITNLSERPRPFNINTRCPLCLCYLASVKIYRHHVGQHLEDIALFILPKIYKDHPSVGEEISEDGSEHDVSHVGSGYSLRREPSDLQAGEEHNSELDWSINLRHLEEEQRSEDCLDQEPGYSDSDWDEIRENRDIEEHKRKETEEVAGGHCALHFSNELDVLVDRFQILRTSTERSLQNQGIYTAEFEERARIKDEEPKLRETVNKEGAHKDKTTEEPSPNFLEIGEEVHRNLEKINDGYRNNWINQAHKYNEAKDKFKETGEKFGETEEDFKAIQQNIKKLEEETENTKEAQIILGKLKRELDILEKSRILGLLNSPEYRRGLVSAEYVDVVVEEQANEHQEEHAMQIQQENELATNPPEAPAAPEPLDPRYGSVSAEYVDDIAKIRAKDTAERYNEEREPEYKHQLQEQQLRSGLDEEDINAIISGKKIEKQDTNELSDRPTWTRMARKHLSLETLRVFNIDYQLDLDTDYVLINSWVPENEQGMLWAHTTHIRQERHESVRDQLVKNEYNQKEMKHQQDTTLKPRSKLARKIQHYWQCCCCRGSFMLVKNHDICTYVNCEHIRCAYCPVTEDRVRKSYE